MLWEREHVLFGQLYIARSGLRKFFVHVSASLSLPSVHLNAY